MEFARPEVFLTVDIIALVTNGIMGGVIARRMNFDPVGFVVMAIVTALGGGIVRDLMIDQGPPVATTNPWYLPAAILGAFIAFLMPLNGKWTTRVLTVLDGLALGAWSATGTLKALAAGLDWLPSLLLGVMTAVGGGMIRDFMVGQVPTVFRRSPLYATASLFGSVQMLVFFYVKLPDWGMFVAMFSVAILVILAQKYNLYLPGPAEIRLPRRRIPSILRREARSANPSTGAIPVIDAAAGSRTDGTTDSASDAMATHREAGGSVTQNQRLSQQRIEHQHRIHKRRVQQTQAKRAQARQASASSRAATGHLTSTMPKWRLKQARNNR
ncbi:trimeric intracellular cation channel family protein [Pseudoglutamicibacter cumminsii]|uniref:trimeric intracellular cation channel family protein n=1 Tax=Pseudoglutamicibacter cumminsii TaxID=156979 RepID=UPI002555C7BF|nr:trimeric intracellular cation channel family protein [Pseudoglutamicibacter cumminsii]MDK7083264.1 trimeric intracellular cation channel family protein [Pseudoglutamicibacter cumminsii]